jgi:hypothetical protein
MEKSQEEYDREFELALEESWLKIAWAHGQPKASIPNDFREGFRLGAIWLGRIEIARNRSYGERFYPGQPVDRLRDKPVSAQRQKRTPALRLLG